VEMVETAAILNHAGPRSFVILDEIGRGTATFDGLSIAWAALEHLHEMNRCRALFATHYHELTALAAKLPALACHTMRVKEWQGDVVFLHEVAPGAADRSYGIHVAKLAGLPAAVIARAEAVLETLEKGEQSGALTRLAEDLPLFSAARPAPPPTAPAAPSAVEAAPAATPRSTPPRCRAPPTGATGRRRMSMSPGRGSPSPCCRSAAISCSSSSATSGRRTHGASRRATATGAATTSPSRSATSTPRSTT